MSLKTQDLAHVDSLTRSDEQATGGKVAPTPRTEFCFETWKAEQAAKRADRRLELQTALADGLAVWHGGSVWSTAGVIRIAGRFGRLETEAGAAFIEPYQSDPIYLAEHLENREHGFGFETIIIHANDCDCGATGCMTCDEAFASDEADMAKNPAAVTLGTLGGQARAKLPKADLSRIGRLGGRPRVYRLTEVPGWLEKLIDGRWVLIRPPYDRAAREALRRLKEHESESRDDRQR